MNNRRGEKKDAERDDSSRKIHEIEIRFRRLRIMKAVKNFDPPGLKVSFGVAMSEDRNKIDSDHWLKPRPNK